MSERRVVITGMGVVTPVGNDLQTFWQSLLAWAKNLFTRPKTRA